MPSQFLPGDVEVALSALLEGQLEGVETSPLGAAEIDDSDELILITPCARPRFIETSYGNASDLTATTYPDTEHIYEIWCAATNLTSKAAQRASTKEVVAQVLAIVAGAKLALQDGGSSMPIRLAGVGSMPEDLIGMIYMIRIAVPGIAQF